MHWRCFSDPQPWVDLSAQAAGESVVGLAKSSVPISSLFAAVSDLACATDRPNHKLRMEVTKGFQKPVSKE